MVNLGKDYPNINKQSYSLGVLRLAQGLEEGIDRHRQEKQERCLGLLQYQYCGL